MLSFITKIVKNKGKELHLTKYFKNIETWLLAHMVIITLKFLQMLC